MNSMHIEIHTDVYDKNEKRTRLSLFLVDLNGDGIGERICGPKYSDFSPIKEIKVELNLGQAKLLQNELSKYILELEIEVAK